MTNRVCLVLVAGLACAARADLIVNGGFESGFTGWTRAEQLGSAGTFSDQTGATSPVNALPVQPPAQGTHAAMSDAAGPGSRVLYQDIVIPASVPGATVAFSLYVNNRATAFSTPASLDFSTPTLNQQARVDLMSASADPFSVAGADIFQSLFQTAVGAPLVSGYTPFSIDITAVLAAHAGQTVRLRFAEVDNVNIFNLGVDGVSLNVPAPAAGVLPIALLALRRRRR